MGYYDKDSVEQFFDENSVASKAPASFWKKAIPAAIEMGFGVREFNNDTIIVVTPQGTQKVYEGFKEPVSAVTLGIVLTHAILSTSYH